MVLKVKVAPVNLQLISKSVAQRTLHVVHIMSAIDFEALMAAELAASNNQKESYTTPASPPTSLLEKRLDPLTLPDVVLEESKLPCFEDYCVSPAWAPSVYYVPDFFTEKDQTSILSAVDSVPSESWTCLRRRRLQQFGGTPLPEGMECEAMAPYLESLMKRLVDCAVFAKDESPITC